jgi:acyl-coenzyme A thioesterase PaaI-like protein
MNRLSKTVKKLENKPFDLLSKAIGRVVPFVGTSGLHFEKMTKERVIVTLKNKRKVRNHIGQIHAAAMILLAETATGMVVGMHVPDDKVPLVKSLKTDFVRRSEGAMRAEAWLTAEQQEAIRSLPKGEVVVAVKVTDESGEEPILCEAVWAWREKRK